MAARPQLCRAHRSQPRAVSWALHRVGRRARLEAAARDHEADPGALPAKPVSPAQGERRADQLPGTARAPGPFKSVLQVVSPAELPALQPGERARAAALGAAVTEACAHQSRGRAGDANAESR